MHRNDGAKFTFLMAGVLGGFTTFSAFNLKTLHQLKSGAPGAALLNVLASVLLCVAEAPLGWLAGSRLGGA